MSEISRKYSRRTIALFWCLAVSILIGVLLYFEQIAVLYVLATVGLVILLLIVAFADLEKVGRENIESFAPKNE
jgi:membrane protein YdbS with pleckstrin-like domain